MDKNKMPTAFHGIKDVVIAKKTEEGYETIVKMGERIGTAK